MKKTIAAESMVPPPVLARFLTPVLLQNIHLCPAMHGFSCIAVSCQEFQSHHIVFISLKNK